MPLDIAAILQVLETGTMPEEYRVEMPETSSISKIESENVAKKTKLFINTYDDINKQPIPKTYADLAHLIDISMKAPQEYKERMSTFEFTLKGLYSRTLEKAAYATAEPVWKALKAGSKAVGLDNMASYFDDRVKAAQMPPVTEEFDEQIAILLDEAKKKGKFDEAAAMLGYSVMEALAFLTRAALVKSIPGIGKVIPSGVEIPKEAARMFTGLGTLADVRRHAAILGTVGVLETPGNLTGRMQGAIYRIAYNITPFIANATPFIGWGARATDTMLNMFLTSPSYVKAFKSSKDAGEFFVKIIPEFAFDVIFALQTTGSPMSHRLAQMGKIPSLAKMTRSEKIAFLKMADKMAEPKLDYGAEIKPSEDREVRIDTMKDSNNLNKMDRLVQKLNTGDEITGDDIPSGMSMTDVTNKLIAKAEKAVTEAEAKKPKHPPARKVQKALNDERVDVCISSMEKSGKVPDNVSEKIVEEYSLLKKVTGPLKAYVAGNRLIENIAGYADRLKPYGPNWKILYGDVNDAESTKLTGLHERVEAMQSFVKSTHGDKDAGRVATKRRLVGKFSLTDDDIMSVYVGTFDKGVVTHLKRGNGFTDRELKQCVSIVENSPKLKATADWVLQKYSDDHAPLAKAHMEATGKALPKRPFFMHIPVDFKEATFEKDNIVEQMMQRDQMGTHAYVSSGITKERVHSSRPMNLGLLANYLKYINEAEHYKAFVRPIKNLTDLLKDPRYKTSIDRNLGHAAWQQLDKYAKDVAGTKTGSNWDTMDRIASITRRHTGIVLIGANILTGFRQTISGFNAAAEIGPYWMLHGMERVIRDPKGVQDIVHPKSSQIKYRAGMWERFIAEERKAEKAPAIIAGKVTPQKMFMAISSFFDRKTVEAAAIGTYDKVITTGRTVDGDRIPNNDLERVAILEMERVSRKTQPHVSAKDLPGWHRGSTVARMFTMFQNMVNKNLNYYDYDIVGKLRYGKITPGTATQRVLFAYIMPMLMLGMIARGRFPRAKEELIKDMTRYPLAGAFIVGSMINTAIDDYGDWTPPVFLGPQAGVKAATALGRAEWEVAGKYGLQATAYLLGVPYNQVYRTYKGTLALMNNETDDWRRLIWSEYALTKGLPKPVASRRARKKRKGR